MLAAHFAKLFATEMGRPAPAINAQAIDVLVAHPFPGNIRELKNVIEGALIDSGSREIRPEHLKLAVLNVALSQAGAAAGRPVPVVSTTEIPLNLEQAERVLIQKALAQTAGNVSKAAELLGVNRAKLYRVMAQLEGEGEPETGRDIRAS